jgi:hypothetical protein
MDKIHTYLDKIDDLKDQVDAQSEAILDKIDIDELLKDPAEYMKLLGTQFYEAHIDEIQDAIKAGQKKAKAVLSDIN